MKGPVCFGEGPNALKRGQQGRRVGARRTPTSKRSSCSLVPPQCRLLRAL